MCDKNLVELQQTLYTSKNPTRKWLHCTRRDWIIRTIHLYALQKGGKALEVGPGSGVYLPVLSTLFEEVTAADSEEAYLSNARSLTKRYPNLKLIRDDITASNLPGEHYDLVLCTEVVEHIKDSPTAFKEIQRVLKPGGILILSTPQRYSTLELMGKVAFKPGIINVIRLIYREPILETGHINLMTEKQLRDQMQSAGFQVREHYKSGLYLPLIAEFMGVFGLHLEQWLESRMHHGPFEGLLWTQYCIAVKVDKRNGFNH